MPKITVHGGPSNAAAREDDPDSVALGTDEHTETDAVTPVDAAPVEDEPTSDYSGSTAADLRALCAARGLTTSGTKTDLVARLTEQDQQTPDH